MGALNRKLWALDEMIEEVESAQGGSYFQHYFGRKGQATTTISEADEGTSVLEAARFAARAAVTHDF